MANSTFSNAEDLSLGTGELYFKRKSSTPATDKFHHMGNCEKCDVKTDITKVEKFSSMNQAREQMASVVTAVKPSIAITMNEYDPTNLALGLFGTEGVYTQTAKTVVDEVHASSKDCIIELKDSLGNRYFNVTDIEVKRGTPVPASLSAVVKETALASDGVIAVSGTYTGANNANYFLKVKTAPTTAGQVAGLEFEYSNALAGIYAGSVLFTNVTGTQSVALADGIKVNITLTGVQTFAVGEIYSFTATSAGGAYIAGKDYVIEYQASSMGLVKIPATSTITGSTVKISYKVPEGVFPKVSGGNAGKIEGELLFLGDNGMSTVYNANFWKVSLTPSGDLTGLIGTDFGSFELTGDILSDRLNHPDEPFYHYVKIR